MSQGKTTPSNSALGSALETQSSASAAPAPSLTHRRFGGISRTRLALRIFLSSLAFDAAGCAVEVGDQRLEMKKSPVTVGVQNPGISLSKTKGEGADTASDCPELDAARAELEKRSGELDTATELSVGSDIASRAANGVSLSRAREAVGVSHQRVKDAQKACDEQRTQTVRNFFGLGN